MIRTFTEDHGFVPVSDTELDEILARARAEVDGEDASTEVRAEGVAEFQTHARGDIERLVETVKCLRRDKEKLLRVAERARDFVRRPEDLPGIELSEALYDVRELN